MRMHVGSRSMRGTLSVLFLGAAFLCRVVMPIADAAGADPNYDEAAVRPYTLPALLAGPDGTPVASAAAWRETARPHQFTLLERYVYGRRLPARPVTVVGQVERAEVTLGGVAATRLQATLRLGELSGTAPFRYSVMVFAILSGVLVFGQFPDEIAMLGMALVVIAGLYAARREAKQAAKTAFSDSARTTAP